MRSTEEEALGGRNAVLQRECPDYLVCTVLDTERVPEQKGSTALVFASWELCWLLDLSVLG